MRAINSLTDAQIVLKELLDWKDTQISKAKDQRGLQIKNAGDATDPTDLVTLRQLKPTSVFIQKKMDGGTFTGTGEFSFQIDFVTASPGKLVAVNNFSVDITQYQRVNFCYSPQAIVDTDLTVNIVITPDYGNSWVILETLQITVGNKNSWTGRSLPKDQMHPYSGSAPFRTLSSGDQLNFTVESGSANGLTIKLDTKTNA
jgi:hypothetical protein